MKYSVLFSTQFKRDYKLILKQGKDENKLKNVVSMLANGEPLPQKYRDHNLAGEYFGCRECHIEPDWLLIYTINEKTIILTLTRTGSHSDLFE
jgi:mRNA interferase YafQ